MIDPRVRRAASHIGNAVLWVAAILGAVSLLLGLATVVAGVQPLIFRSSSMSPAIDAGALGIARTVPAADVEKGDIVSVTDTEGVRVTHRVVSVTKAAGNQVSLTLKGDANASPDKDPYLATEVDRVIFDVPYLGYVANWLASPWAMFAAGIVVALLVASLWRRPGTGHRSRGGSSVAAVAAVGLAAAALVPVPRTEAYYFDDSTFTAGAIHATTVTIFDLEGDCVQDGNQIRLKYKIPSLRFTTIWHRTAVDAPVTATSEFLRELDPPGGKDTVVETIFTRADVAVGGAVNGAYQIVGRSKLRGSATTPWTSVSERRIGIMIDATGVRCGTTNLAPTVTFTRPLDNGLYFSRDQIDTETTLYCGRQAPCGTATDLNGIYRVEYKLQRSNFWSTQCWAPEALITGFYSGACGSYRTADTSPQTPTSTGGTVTWRIPLGSNGPGTTFNQTGDYVLYLRVYDNASPRVITERTIRFTVR